MYDLQVFFFLFSMLLLPSCWSLEAQIVTYDRSVACAFDIYSNVGKIPFFFSPKVAKIPLFSNSFMDFAFRSVITFWVIFCIWGEGINFSVVWPHLLKRWFLWYPWRSVAHYAGYYLGNLCHLVCWPSCLHCYSFVVRLETSTRVSPSSYFLGSVGPLVFLCGFKHQFVCFSGKVELWIRIVR